MHLAEVLAKPKPRESAVSSADRSFTQSKGISRPSTAPLRRSMPLASRNKTAARKEVVRC